MTVKSVKRVNANSIVFNLSDTYRSRMMQVIEAQSANKGVLSEMYSLQLVTSLEMLEKCDEDT